MTSHRAAPLNPFTVLRTHRNFRLFWSGQTLSLIGTWMQSVAQGWIALELTDDPLMVGIVTAALAVPVLLLSLPAGVLVDRYDKLRLITIAQSFLLLQAALLWWLVWSGQIDIAWLIGLALAAGTFNAVEIPARQSLVIELVGKEDIIQAIALNSSGFNLARIVGPSLAAVTIASLGIEWCFGFNAISYLAVLGVLVMIRLPPRREAPHAVAAFAGLRQGFAYMRSTREVATLMRMAAAYSILGVPYLTLMPVFARDVLRLDASGYGSMLTAVGVGALGGALILASFGRRIPRGRALAMAAHAFPAALILFSLTRHYIAAVAVLLAAGFMMIATNALTNGLLQSIVPDAFRGRVMAAYTFVFVGLSPLGSLLAGAVARSTGVASAIGGAAAILLLFALFTFHRHPEIRQL